MSQLPNDDVTLGVPLRMDSKDVFEFFTKFGPVEYAKVHDNQYVNSRFAFVTFETRETRQRVLNAGEAELTLRNGKKLKVGVARRKETRGWTWFRSTKHTEEGPSAACLGYQDVHAVQDAQAVQQYQLPLSELHCNMPAPHSQSIPLNIISTEQQQMIYNNISAEEQMIYNNNSGEQHMIYNNYLPNYIYLTNPVAYYSPGAGMMFPQYQQQFPFPQ